MSPPLLLRAFVNERLTAAAEEIFQVFEKTIAKYEEEASSSKQEIERLRGLLQDFVSNQKTGVSHTSVCKDETPSELELSLGVHQDPDLEPRHIKEEDHELWADQQQEEDHQVGEFNNADVLYPPHSSVWEENEQEDTKPSLQTQIQNSEQEEEFQETKEVHFISPLGSTTSPQTLILNESVQDGRESDRPAASFTLDQTQTEQSQTSFSTSTELSHLNSVVPDYHCYLCDKTFSSTHHLINHAVRIHSKDDDVMCAVCGNSFESSESLNVHLQTHKGSKCCHMCGKHCYSTTALTEHMASHAGVKLHRCHVCGKECSRKGDLKIHMRIHTGEKPFCCSFCCKSFTHSGHLRKHMRSHTGERPHRCDVCGRGFLQSAHLKYHLGTHAQKY